MANFFDFLAWLLPEPYTVSWKCLFCTQPKWIWKGIHFLRTFTTVKVRMLLSHQFIITPLFSCFLSLSLSFLLFIPFILISRNLKISETLCAVVHYFLHPYPRYSLMPSYTYWTSPRYFTYVLPGGEALDSLAENFESVWRKSNCFCSQIYGFIAFMVFMLKRFRKK